MQMRHVRALLSVRLRAFAFSAYNCVRVRELVWILLGGSKGAEEKEVTVN